MLVDGCWACRPGKGVHAAVGSVQRNLQRWPWFVQVDVDGYFPSIDHARLKNLLARLFKGREFLALLGRIIDGGAGATPGLGLPIGALTSQHFANCFLDAGDRMLLARSDVVAALRYMDDIVWWCRSRDDALASLDAFGRFLWQERRLRLKLGARVGPSAGGLSFCGFRIRPGVVLASARKLERYRGGLRRIEAAAADGIVNATEAQRAHDGLLAALAGTESLKFRRRLCGEHDDRGSLEPYDTLPGCRSL